MTGLRGGDEADGGLVPGKGGKSESVKRGEGETPSGRSVCLGEEPGGMTGEREAPETREGMHG